MGEEARWRFRYGRVKCRQGLWDHRDWSCSPWDPLCAHPLSVCWSAGSKV